MHEIQRKSIKQGKERTIKIENPGIKGQNRKKSIKQDKEKQTNKERTQT